MHCYHLEIVHTLSHAQKRTNWAHLKTREVHFSLSSMKSPRENRVRGAATLQPASLHPCGPSSEVKASPRQRILQENSFLKKPTAGLFEFPFQCFRLSWPTGMWSRHICNTDVLTVLAATGQCRRCSAKGTGPAVLPGSGSCEEAAEQPSCLQAPSSSILHWRLLRHITVGLCHFLRIPFLLPF